MHKNSKTFLIAVVVLLVAIPLLGYLATRIPKMDTVLTEDAPNPSPAASPDATETKLEPAPSEVYAASDFKWVVENAPDYEETMPRQLVSLEVNGRRYPVGPSTGCSVADDAVLPPDVIARQTCWFAGGGDEFFVLKEGDSYVVKSRFIQETEGDEGAPPIGPMRTILTIE